MNDFFKILFNHKVEVGRCIHPLHSNLNLTLTIHVILVTLTDRLGFQCNGLIVYSLLPHKLYGGMYKKGFKLP